MLRPLEVLRLYPPHDGTLAGALESRLSVRGDSLFMIFGKKNWSWRDFTEASHHLAQALARRGVGKGDRVAIIDRNSDWHILLLFALARLGAIMVPVNPEFGGREAAYIFANAEVSGIIAGAETIATVRSALDERARPWIVLTEKVAGEDAPAMAELMAERPGISLPGTISSADTCLIIYTSGTTGFPKGVMHSQWNFLTVGEGFVERMHLQPDDRAMIVMPFFHMNALFYSVAGTVAAGASMVIVPKFSASRFWQTVVEAGATHANVIEAIGTILVARPRSEFLAEHRMRAVYGVRPRFVEAFRRDFGIHTLISGYGMTEVPGVISWAYEVPDKTGSMGRVGAHPDRSRPWAQCRVMREDGSETEANETGELWVRTPVVMQGYFRDPEQTRAAFEGDWFKTGDLVKRDQEGWYYFVSRKKDIIRRRGENIAALELERVICEHPDVYEAAAIGVSSELGEDEILAAVVAKKGRMPGPHAIADWCRDRLAANKVPRFVVFLDELPHTPTHKIAKAVLIKDESLRARAVDLERERQAPLAGAQAGSAP